MLMRAMTAWSRTLRRAFSHYGESSCRMAGATNHMNRRGNMPESNQPTMSTPSRREFLGNTGAAAAALLAASQVGAADAKGDGAAAAAAAKAAEKPKRPLKKAIMFGMFQMEGSLVEKFTALK